MTLHAKRPDFITSLRRTAYRPIHVFRFNPDAKPLPVIINKETGIASEGPGYKALMDKIVKSYSHLVGMG